MENEKINNKGLILALVILTILVLGLSGYIIFDKMVPVKNTKTSIEDSDKSNSNKKIEKEVKNTISESEALSIGNELWKYAYSTYWGEETVWTKHLSDKPNEYGAQYYICDTTAEQVKQKYTSDFKAQSCYSDTTCTNYTIDTFVTQTACESAGRGGNQTYKDTSLTIKDIQDDKIVFTATSAYCSSSFCIDSNDTAKEIKKDFVIKKQNNNWLIADFYLPN